MDYQNCDRYRIELQRPVCQVNEHCPYQVESNITFEGETFNLCGKVLSNYDHRSLSRLPIIEGEKPAQRVRSLKEVISNILLHTL